MSPTGPDPDAGPVATDPPRGWWRRATARIRPWLTWVVRPRLCFGGLAVALVCFWLSLTPSLLPRGWLFQGVVSGLIVAMGYGLGSAISAVARATPLHEPSARAKRAAWKVLAAVAVVGSALLLWESQRWQHELRQLMGIDDDPAFSVVGVLLVAAVVGALVLVGARLVRSFARFLVRQVLRIAPPPVARVAGVVLALVVIVGFVQGFLLRGAVSALNRMAGTVNGSTREGTERPTAPTRSGSPASLVAWDSLGRMGRDFTGRGPTRADLEQFFEPGCCREPIRVYAGLESAGSASARAALAVRELERTHAFDREYVAVFTATGTGWINPNVSSALEYLHRGDTAEVSMQYSYLPSWLSFLVDQSKAEEAGRELIGAVLRRVDALPADRRPKVLLYGESLGSYGTESAFSGIADLQARVDGAMLVGPTFENPIWKRLTDGRVAGSPEWLPRVRRPGVYFAKDPADLRGVGTGADGPRVVYLQNASDPITWWNVPLAYREPDWAGSPRAPDRSPAFRWVPALTFTQVMVDLADSLSVPAGHGHYFGANVVDGWVAVDRPPGWTDADTQRVRRAVTRAR